MNKMKIIDFPWGVVCRSDKLDLRHDVGNPSVLCSSKSQAEHMVKFWGKNYGQIVRLNDRRNGKDRRKDEE